MTRANAAAKVAKVPTEAKAIHIAISLALL
jgi:hypothetical protein